MRPEQGTLISRAQAMAALLELLTDQPVIVCNGFPKLKHRGAFIPLQPR